jgi:UDPglucose--hexose-1-phosphate uridylyltransferase
LEYLKNQSHKRFNILTEEWVLVSPHRTNRPWQGKQESNIKHNAPCYDPQCYLCPGNERANGEINPEYDDVYVFANDYSALNNSGEEIPAYSNGLLQAAPETGICRVVCFSPDHSKSLADMSVEETARVVAMWRKQYIELEQNPDINYVQIFENKGSIMGCSNPHPHGQIWSQSSIPNEALKRDRSQKRYYSTHKKSMLSSYLKQELSLKAF